MEHEARAIRGVRLALLSNIAGVVLQTLIMAVLGYGLDQLARALENRIVHWGGREG